MDGHALELADGSVDMAGSQFGVMLFPDMPKGIREMARVVKPGGTGTKAFCPEWAIGGKTGTTKKIDPATGTYSSTMYIGSFCGFAPAERPRVILRYGDARDLLVSGLLDGGGELAQHAAVVDVPTERGHVLMFSINPVWRGETQGSYFFVFNAILNFDNLNAGRRPGER